jgi:hypothetical protein
VENFSVNSAKSYIGRNVNLHLKDGAVIVNVQLIGIHRGSGKNSLIEFTPNRNRRAVRMPLRNVAWAEMLNPNLMQRAA